MQEIRFQIPVPVGGVRKDLAETAVPPDALIDATNMVMRHGRFVSRYGLATFGSNTPADPVIAAIGYTHSDGADRLVVMTETSWRYWDGAGWTNLGSFLAAANHGTFRVFQKDGATWLIGINDQVTIMRRWDGTGALGTVGGTPPKAKAMMVLANRVLLFNLADNGAYSGVISPVGYDVSAFNDFDSGWGTTLNGLLVDTPGPIVAALEMGDLQGAIYKTDAIVMAVAQAATVPFRFEWRVIGNVGPANSRCVVAMSDGSHVFLGADGALYRFDGVSSVSLGQHVQKAILNTCQQSLLATHAFVAYDKERGEILCFYKQPTGQGDRFRSIVVDANGSVWPMTYGTLSQSKGAFGRFQRPSSTATEIMGFFGSSGQAYTESGFGDAGPATYSSMWQYGYVGMDVPDNWKTINEINHFFDTVGVVIGGDGYPVVQGGTETVTLDLFYTDRGNYPQLTAESPQSIAVSYDGTSTAAYVTDHRATAKLFSLRYSSVIDSMSIEYRGASGVAVLRGER